MGRLVLASVQVALLGPLEVRSEKGPVELSAPKQRAVVEMLALRPGRPVTAELLIAGLWGESPPASAAKVLQTYVSRLRGAIPELCLLTSGNAYSLKLEPGSVDAQRFEGAVREASQRTETGDARGAVAVLAQALDLWRGRPCEELVEHSWATAEVARLEEMRREAEDDLADLRLAIGEHNAMVGQLEAAVAAEPLRERRWAQLMLAYYRSGRQADALRAFGRLRSVLAEELGLSPSADLAALEQKVLLQSPELDQRPFAGRGAQRPGARAPLRRSAPPGQQLRRPGRRSGRSGQVGRGAPPRHPGRCGRLREDQAGPGSGRDAWQAASPKAPTSSLSPLSSTQRRYRLPWPRPSACGPSPVVQLPKWWQKWSGIARPSPS